ncbi:hypothetical protein [Micromonospora sp. NPDC092111]|uniref:hypothetical protein n=1 Tax=Micromonospora sp. NPDC092111 TaxID=3364289 RepID=UPI00382DB0F6
MNTLDNVLSMIPDPGSANVLLTADYMYPLANQIAKPLAATVLALTLAGNLSVIAAAARTSQLRPP